MSVKWYYEDPVVVKRVEYIIPPKNTPEWLLMQRRAIHKAVGPRGPEQVLLTKYFKKKAQPSSRVVDK